MNIFSLQNASSTKLKIYNGFLNGHYLRAYEPYRVFISLHKNVQNNVLNIRPLKVLQIGIGSNIKA